VYALASCVIVLMACWCFCAMSCFAISEAMFASPPVSRPAARPVPQLESMFAACCSSHVGGLGMLPRAQLSALAVFVTATLVFAALSACVCILFATVCDCWKYASAAAPCHCD